MDLRVGFYNRAIKKYGLDEWNNQEMMDDVLHEVMYTGINHPERMKEYFSKNFHHEGYNGANYFDSIEDVLERNAFWFGLSSWDTYKDGTEIRNIIKEYIETEQNGIKKNAYNILNNSGKKYTYSIISPKEVLEFEPEIYNKCQDFENHMDYFENLVKQWQEENK